LKGSDWPDLRDAWGTEVRIDPAPWDPSHTYYTVRSAGPDQRFDTGDDLTLNILVRTGRLATRATSEGMRLKVEHNRGAFNGLAEIVGTVTDLTGAVIPNATVELVDAHSKKTRHAKTGANGEFSFSGLPASEYTIQVSAQGFRTGLRAFSLQPRDRVVVDATLQVGAVTQTVEVNAAVPMLETEQAMVSGRNVIDVRAPPPPSNGPDTGGGIGAGEAGGVLGGVFNAAEARKIRVGGQAQAARVPTFPRRSTSIPRSSPMRTVAPVLLFRLLIPSPPGVWP
jgi:hypothetical protein